MSLKTRTYRTTSSRRWLSAVLVLVLLLGPAAAVAEELEPHERERLEEDKTLYRVTQILSIGGIVVGTGITGLGTWGVVRGLQPCDGGSPDCESDRVVALSVGASGAIVGLGLTGASIVGLVASNQNLKRVNRRLSIRFIPRPDGGSAQLQWQF